ncbi:MAG: histidinol-phosphatase HisJ family protein [Ghiorsea sp.]
MKNHGFSVVPDYHMHTPRCNHATGTIREYALAACEAGLREIGMSDHSPMPNGFDKAWRMDESELASFIAELEAAKAEFAGQLSIKSALEVDFYPGAEPYIEYLAQQYDWDYLMGSVHFIADWGFDNPDEIEKWQGKNMDQVYCDYFALVGESAATGLFDIIGHPDLIKKFGFRPDSPSDLLWEAEEKMLQAVKHADVSLEISSAGLRKPAKEIYPKQSIVQRAASLDIPFAYGSDAHAPEEVGHGMVDCLSSLGACGVTKLSHFKQRKRQIVSFLSEKP